MHGILSRCEDIPPEPGVPLPFGNIDEVVGTIRFVIAGRDVGGFLGLDDIRKVTGVTGEIKLHDYLYIERR